MILPAGFLLAPFLNKIEGEFRAERINLGGVSEACIATISGIITIAAVFRTGEKTFCVHRKLAFLLRSEFYWGFFFATHFVAIFMYS